MPVSAGVGLDAAKLDPVSPTVTDDCRASVLADDADDDGTVLITCLAEPDCIVGDADCVFNDAVETPGSPPTVTVFPCIVELTLPGLLVSTV